MPATSSVRDAALQFMPLHAHWGAAGSWAYAQIFYLGPAGSLGRLCTTTRQLQAVVQAAGRSPSHCAQCDYVISHCCAPNHLPTPPRPTSSLWAAAVPRIQAGPAPLAVTHTLLTARWSRATAAKPVPRSETATRAQSVAATGPQGRAAPAAAVRWWRVTCA